MADGTPLDSAHDVPFDGAHDRRSVPATSNGKGRGWDSVVVEESDVLACGGYLPEKYIGGAGEGDGEVGHGAALADDALNPGTTSSQAEEAGTCDMDLNAGGVGEVAQEIRADGADRGCENELGDGALGRLTSDVREAPTSATCGGAAQEAATAEMRRTKPIFVMTCA